MGVQRYYPNNLNGNRTNIKNSVMLLFRFVVFFFTTRYQKWTSKIVNNLKISQRIINLKRKKCYNLLLHYSAITI